MRGARIAAAVLLLGCAALGACDVPIAGPPRADKGEAVVESPSEARVQVIVRLRFDAPDGAKPDEDAYREALQATRARFLADIAALPHRVVRTYDTLPLIVLVIAPADRAALEQLPSVASLEEDRLNAPLAQ